MSPVRAATFAARSMRGHEEIERLLAIIADGVRAQMGRPKCLARPSWVDDPTETLLRRHSEELVELANARESLRTLRGLIAGGAQGKAPSSEWPIYEACLRQVFLESVDVVNFAAMLVDPLRLGRIFCEEHPARFVA